jgi:RecA/RadA recombinase
MRYYFHKIYTNVAMLPIIEGIMHADFITPLYNLSYYTSIETQVVEWLWYPYIPYGKISIIQGDPGDGKTTFALQIAAMLSKGVPLPNNTETSSPLSIIYQSGEDNPADTIKPRLEAAGADCSKIALINTLDAPLSISDERLEKAIIEADAKLLVLDPLQAFIPEDCDLSRALDMREAMSSLAGIAERTHCAVVIIGHLNKSTGIKNLYRGIGSIDIAAIARSVLYIARPDDKSSLRIVIHIKSNLAKAGSSVAFTFDDDGRFMWVNLAESLTESDLSSFPINVVQDSKQKVIERFLIELLTSGEKSAQDVFALCSERGYAKRTVDRAKKSLKIRSYRKNGEWVWSVTS